MNRATESYQAIVKHPFIVESIQTAMRRLDEKGLISLSPEQRSDHSAEANMDELTYYLDLCGSTIARLLGRLEQICIIPAYISEYKRTKTMNRYRVNRYLDIAYHIENFYIRSTSIADQFLQVYNAVFHLGFPENQVSARTILDNNHIRTSNSYRLIRGMDKDWRLHSSTRNGIIHRGRHHDLQLTSIQMMLLSSRYEHNLKRYSATRYRVQLRDYSRSKTDEIERYLQKTLSKTLELLSALQIDYHRVRSSLDTTE